MVIPDSVREFLATGPLAHVVALHADGRPHVTLAWAGPDGDELVFSTFFDQHKVRDFERDPRVSLSFQAIEHTGKGLHPYLVIEGRVTIVEGGALAVNRDASHYDMGLCGPHRTDLARQTQYCGMFLTPTLRNSATRHAFFHNGVYHSLDQVLTFYNLVAITGAHEYYRPERAPQTMRVAIQNWRQRAERGTITWRTEPGPLWDYKPVAEEAAPETRGPAAPLPPLRPLREEP